MSVAVSVAPSFRSPRPAGQAFAKFMEFRGYKVVERFGVLWHSVPGNMFMSFPYHLRLNLEPEEVARMLRDLRAAGVRYPSVTNPGAPSGLYVVHPSQYSLGSLDSKVRRAMKRGLAECEVRRLTSAELREDAIALNLETMRRQNRFDAEFGDPARWERFCAAIEACSCVHALGSFIEGRLGAYIVGCLEDGWLNLLYRFSTYSYPELNPSRVLDFRVIDEFAREHNVHTCSMGVLPLVDNPGLHTYKSRIGVLVEPQHSVVRLHPAIEPFIVRGASVRLAEFAARLFPRHEALEKGAAVLRAAVCSRPLTRGLMLESVD